MKKRFIAWEPMTNAAHEIVKRLFSGCVGACLLGTLFVPLVGCQTTTLSTKDKPRRCIQKSFFGKTPKGEVIDRYALTNSNGMKAAVMNYGATLIALEVPDRNGKLADVVLGHDTLEGYINGVGYLGATIGRFAGRINKGRFTLNGIAYNLAPNNGEHHLHGGIKGFDKVVWQAQAIEGPDFVGVKLIYLSKDGEEGYPGNLSCTVTYSLTNGNQLKIRYEAETDETTPINLTHHSYFNLAGAGSGNVLSHELFIDASRYVVATDDLIPTGEFASVKNTCMDFTKPTPIGAGIDRLARQHYDDDYLLNDNSDSLSLAARVYEPRSGRVMKAFSTEPVVHLYIDNFLHAVNEKGKGGLIYRDKHNGFCLEMQHISNSPNQPNFPSTILEPGQKYMQLTVYAFSTK